jgi:hypothetical protein
MRVGLTDRVWWEHILRHGYLFWEDPCGCELEEDSNRSLTALFMSATGEPIYKTGMKLHIVHGQVWKPGWTFGNTSYDYPSLCSGLKEYRAGIGECVYLGIST